MAKRKIVWTEKANLERQEILEYWVNRNKSKTYSIKLNNLFKESLKKLAETPTIGRTTEFENTRVKIIRDYLVFYEYDLNQIKIQAIGDGNRDEKSLKIK